MEGVIYRFHVGVVRKIRRTKESGCSENRLSLGKTAFIPLQLQRLCLFRIYRIHHTTDNDHTECNRRMFISGHYGKLSDYVDNWNLNRFEIKK